MTTFTQPLKVKQLDSENVVFSVSGATGTVSARSSVKVGEDLSVSGATLFTGAVSAKTDVLVSGRIRSGQGGIGNVVLSQSVTVNAQTATAGTQEVNIPTDAHITNISFHVIDDVFATAASDIDIRIGTSGDDDQYATFAASGAAPKFAQLGHVNFTGVSGAALHGKPAGGIFIKTTANASGAVTSKNALLTFTYVRTA